MSGDDINSTKGFIWTHIDQANRFSAGDDVHKFRTNMYKTALDNCLNDLQNDPEVQKYLIPLFLGGPCFRPSDWPANPDKPDNDVVNKIAQLADHQQLNILAETVDENQPAMVKAFVKGVLENKVLSRDLQDHSGNDCYLYTGLDFKVLKLLAKDISDSTGLDEDKHEKLKRIVAAATSRSYDNPLNLKECEEILHIVISQLETEQNFHEVIPAYLYENVITKVGLDSLQKLASLNIRPIQYMDRLLEVVDQKPSDQGGDAKKAEIVDAVFQQQNEESLKQFSTKSLSILAKYTNNPDNLKVLAPRLLSSPDYIHPIGIIGYEKPQEALDTIDEITLQKLVPYVTNIEQLGNIVKAANVNGDIFRAVIDKAKELADIDSKKEIKETVNKHGGGKFLDRIGVRGLIYRCKKLWWRFRESIGRPSEESRKEIQAIEAIKQKHTDALDNTMFAWFRDLCTKCNSTEQNVAKKLQIKPENWPYITHELFKLQNKSNPPRVIPKDDQILMEQIFSERAPIDPQLTDRLRIAQTEYTGSPTVVSYNTKHIEKIKDMLALDEQQEQFHRRKYLCANNPDTSSISVSLKDPGGVPPKKLMEMNSKTGEVLFPLEEAQANILDDHQIALLVQTLLASEDKSKSIHNELTQVDIHCFNVENAVKIMKALNALPPNQLPLLKINFLVQDANGKDIPLDVLPRTEDMLQVGGYVSQLQEFEKKVNGKLELRKNPYLRQKVADGKQAAADGKQAAADGKQAAADGGGALLPQPPWQDRKRLR